MVLLIMSDNRYENLRELANRVSRSTVAVVDAMSQRGAFKGEELSTIGGLRDQCVQIIQLIESIDQEEAIELDESETPHISEN